MFKFTIVVFVSLLLIGSAFSQITTSEVAGPVDNSNAMYYNHGSHVARTSDGNLFVVWAADGNSDIMYSQYDGSGWTTPVLVKQDTINANKSSIVMAPRTGLFLNNPLVSN